MTIHELKCWPACFRNIVAGDKTFEIREDDRDPSFYTGDFLWLREWDPDRPSDLKYSGETLCVEILYTLNYEDCEGLRPGYIAMSILPIPEGLTHSVLGDLLEKLKADAEHWPPRPQ